MNPALATHDEIARRIGAAGVALFDASAAVEAALSAEQLADLLRDVIVRGDARVWVALPCLLVRWDALAAEASRRAALELERPAAERLGLMYRVARYLAVSREPRLRRLLGRLPHPPAVDLEPHGLPEPADRLGEAGLVAARELFRSRRDGDLVGGAERAFDTWLAIEAARRGARVSA